MNNEDKQANLNVSTSINDLQNNINTTEYATKMELNTEANIRHESDYTISSDLEIFKSKHDGEIEEVNTKLSEESTKTDGLVDKITEVKDIAKDTNEKVTGLQTVIAEELHHLEEKNDELSSKLESANQTIAEQESELESLRDELASGNSSNIILPFPNAPEFEITEVMTVKEFINNYLKNIVIEKMLEKYPDVAFGQDYTIALADLDYADVMQSKNNWVIVKGKENGKLKRDVFFEIKITYNYNIDQQEKLVEKFLQPAIPTSLKDIPENKFPDYKVPKELIETKPLKLLLNNKTFKHFSFKIFAEMNAASYWTDFHRDWKDVNEGYVGTGLSKIGAGTTINNVADLYKSNLGYYNRIFKVIEQRLNDSGVPCIITKKSANHSRGLKIIHAIGNLTFNVPSSNLDDDKIVSIQSRHFYTMVNFEVNINNKLKKFYRGVTLFLTDNLELY